jgi:hypothetical protein
MRYWELRNSWGNSGDDGYGRVAFSTDAPINASLQFDIPGPPYPGGNPNEWSGGMISFMPGPLPSELSSGSQPVNSQPQPVNPQPQPQPFNPPSIPTESSQQTICFPIAKAKELLKNSEDATKKSAEVVKRKVSILGVESNTLLIIVGSIIGVLMLVLIILFIININDK